MLERASDPSRFRDGDGGGYRLFRGIFDRVLRVFVPEAIYRRMGKVGGVPGGPHPLVARPPGRIATRCGHPGAPLRLPSGLRVASGKILTLAFVWSNSDNISLLAFLKPKIAENRQLARWHLVNRLVLENV